MRSGQAALLLGRGYLGVDGFFLLSGFVLAHAHPVAPVRLADVAAFWLRRLRRLYPVHACVLALLALAVAGAAAVGLAINDPGRFGTRELVWSLLMVHGWGLSGRWSWNYPSWSISTEWAAYLLFPALWWAVARLPARVAAAVIVTMLAVLAWVGSGRYGLALTYQGALWRCLPEFLIGLSLARLAGPLARWAGSASALLVAGAALLLAVAWLPDAAVVAALAAVLAALAGGSLRGARRLDRLPGLRVLGELSYAFYMSFATAELFTVGLLRRLSLRPDTAPAAYVLLVTALTFALALLLHRYVEMPALRGGRLPHRRASAPVSPRVKPL